MSGGGSFFYVRFASSAADEQLGSASSNPLPPPRSVTPGLYGEDRPLRSRALERGRAAQPEDQRRPYAAVEASAHSAPGLMIGESPGYQARLQGYESRGETDTNEGAWARSLAGDGSTPEDPNQMPVWLGIETTVAGGNRENEDTESSHSRGSFEVV